MFIIDTYDNKSLTLTKNTKGSITYDITNRTSNNYTLLSMNYTNGWDDKFIVYSTRYNKAQIILSVYAIEAGTVTPILSVRWIKNN